MLSNESKEESKRSEIDYERVCMAVVLDLLHDLRQQYRDDTKLDEASAIRFQKGVRLLRVTIAALKLGPNWKRMADLRKQLDELQTELGKEKASE